MRVGESEGQPSFREIWISVQAVHNQIFFQKSIIATTSSEIVPYNWSPEVALKFWCITTAFQAEQPETKGRNLLVADNCQ